MDRRCSVSRPCCLAGLLAGVLAFATPAAAQHSIIRGIVQDPAGNPVAKATVAARPVEGTRIVEDQTDDSGRFAFIGLGRGPWLFVVAKPTYQPARAVWHIRSSSTRGTIRFELEVDPLNPPAPASGRLAGLTADEIQAQVDAAHRAFARGAFEEAIAGYAALLAQAPDLASLNLQIGHAYRAMGDHARARDAYAAVPPGSPARVEAESAQRRLERLAPSR